MKLDNGAKRKISKRKDPEAAVHFFAEQGFPSENVIEYLMTIAASDFEDWRRCNPTASYKDFKFNLKKMSVSGALLMKTDNLNYSLSMCCAEEKRMSLRGGRSPTWQSPEILWQFLRIVRS